MITYDAVVAAARGARQPDRRIAYGPHALNFGDLTLPHGLAARPPVVVVIHGGCWRAEYGIDHVTAMTAALADEGYAVWAIEYRRLGDDGGGWPGTFDDVAAAIDHLAVIVDEASLDPDRVVVAGHSAGGHLALWSATETKRVKPAGVVSLAGISDLASYSSVRGSCNDSVVPLLGGSPAERPERYRLASPIERLPIGVPSVHVHGEADPIVPIEMSERFVAAAREKGDNAELVIVPQAGHFDVIAPEAPAWAAVKAAVNRLAGPG